MTEVTIEAVSKHKMRVSLDGEPAFTVSDRKLRETNLTDGQLLDDQQTQALIEEAAHMACKAALDLLLSRDYGELELIRKLEMKGFSSLLSQRAAAYAASCHYLDDERYIRNLIEQSRGRKSRQALQAKMQLKGLDENLIREAFEAAGWDDGEGLLRELHIRLKGKAPEDLPDTEKTRLIQACLRKGYRYQDVRRALSDYNKHSECP